ncbi:hypothetical protein QBC40DRAFT_320131 [Triangularia verruculosa]|uniref:Uncharacterized protein n=1 Tax=Triangularia verruculosa TaxID=2587418 RepID=A0AAN6XXC2_9PEZI|nr:hypothetical protein QBC40DRAFT_320131 [Triangularia verruculosa]
MSSPTDRVSRQDKTKSEPTKRNQSAGPGPELTAAFVVDPKVVEDAIQTADIYQVRPAREIGNNPIRDKVEHRLAPTKAGSWYLRIRYSTNTADLSDNILCEYDNKFNKPREVEGYVSIRFLLALAKNKVDWRSLRLAKLKSLEADDRLRFKDGTPKEQHELDIEQIEEEEEAQDRANQRRLNLGWGEGMSEEKDGDQDKDDNNTEPDEEDDDKDEQQEFIEDWKSSWQPPTEEDVNKNQDVACYVPVRDKNGTLTFRRTAANSALNYKKAEDARLYKLTWYLLLEKTWKHRTTPSKGQPPRWTRVDLPGGIHILPELDSEDHIVNTKFIDAKFIQDCVVKVNNAKTVEDQAADKKQAGGGENEDRVKWKAFLLQNRPAQDSEYMQISVHPFGFYSTWIKKKDWTAYMKKLGEDCTDPKMAHRNPVHENLLDLVDSDLTGDTVLTDPRIKAVSRRYSAFLEASKEKNDFGRFQHAMRVFQHKKPDARRLFEMITEKHWTKQEPVGFRFNSTLSYHKIKTAAGKRDGSQNQIMGGGSKGVAANIIAQEIGWQHNNQGAKDPEEDEPAPSVTNVTAGVANMTTQPATTAKAQPKGGKQLNGRYKNQLKNLLYTAEWLHLRAYSWGGHLNRPGPLPLDQNAPEHLKNEQGVTLQNPFNLVVGTSETNSFMLRYEKSWQNLFKFEYNFQRKLNRKFNRTDATNIEGNLWIRVNPGSKEPDDPDWPDNKLHVVEYDSFESGNYVVREANLLNKTDKTAVAMVKVAKKFPFLAYSVAYHVRMKTHSYALGKANVDHAVRFFPFRRPFYHQAESILDRLLMTRLKDRLTEQLKAGTIQPVDGQGQRPSGNGRPSSDAGGNKKNNGKPGSGDSFFKGKDNTSKRNDDKDNHQSGGRGYKTHGDFVDGQGTGNSMGYSNYNGGFNNTMGNFGNFGNPGNFGPNQASTNTGSFGNFGNNANNNNSTDDNEDGSPAWMKNPYDPRTIAVREYQQMLTRHQWFGSGGGMGFQQGGMNPNMNYQQGGMNYGMNPNMGFQQGNMYPNPVFNNYNPGNFNNFGSAGFNQNQNSMSNQGQRLAGQDTPLDTNADIDSKTRTRAAPPPVKEKPRLTTAKKAEQKDKLKQKRSEAMTPVGAHNTAMQMGGDRAALLGRSQSHLGGLLEQVERGRRQHFGVLGGKKN